MTEGTNQLTTDDTFTRSCWPGWPPPPSEDGHNIVWRLSLRAVALPHLLDTTATDVTRVPKCNTLRKHDYYEIQIFIAISVFYLHHRRRNSEKAWVDWQIEFTHQLVLYHLLDVCTFTRGQSGTGWKLWSCWYCQIYLEFQYWAL